MKDSRLKNEYIISSLTLLLCVLLAVASSLYFKRLDFTSAREYTLSPTARNLYREIPETIRITYYISGNLAARHPGARAIEDFLKELEAISRGSIRVRIESPDRDTAKVEAYGIAPQQMQVVEQNEQRVALVYTGIVVEYLDSFQAIPAILSTQTLEYDLIKIIRTLINNTSSVAGLLIGDAGKTLETDYRLLAQGLLQAGYQPRQIEHGKPIESDVSVLLVLGNAMLDRYDAYFIDDYMRRGGRVFFAARGVDIDLERGLAAYPVAEDGIIGLLAAYGIELKRQLVLDEANLTVPFQTANNMGGYSIQYIKYPHWINIQSRFANRSHPVTSRFAGLNLFWPSPLSVMPGSNLETTNLVTSTPLAWLQTSSFATSPQDVPRYYFEQAASRGTYILGMSATGRVRSPFSGGDLPQRLGEPALAVPPADPFDVRFIVVSSTDFLSDLMSFSQSEFNLSFALSAADWLNSEEDLIAIRTRSERDLRLNKIQDSATRDALILLVYIVNIVLIPLVMVIWALMRSKARSKREQLARKNRGAEL